MVLGVAVPLLLLMLAGVSAPVIAPLLARARAAAEERHLRRLPYPSMPTGDAESRLVHVSNQGVSFVKTPVLRVETAEAEMVLRADALEQAGVRTEPTGTVSLRLATKSGTLLPLSTFLRTPLVLKTGEGRVEVFSTEFQVSQLSKFRDPDDTSVMDFDVATAAFLAWVQEERPTGDIGDIHFVVPRESREVLRALAASMRPAGRR
jgi:hypothetical protein